MGAETRAFFDRNHSNRNFALKFFEGSTENVVRYMAVQDGIMVGYVFLWDTDKKIPWLGIAVSDDCKGKGLGGRLIDAAKEYCIKNSAGGILLTTHVANIRGQGLYERCGFERMGMHALSGEILYLFRF